MIKLRPKIYERHLPEGVDARLIDKGSFSFSTGRLSRIQGGGSIQFAEEIAHNRAKGIFLEALLKKAEEASADILLLESSDAKTTSSLVAGYGGWLFKVDYVANIELYTTKK